MSGRVTAATDIYAVGALLWRMVAGGAAEHPKLLVTDNRERSEAGSVVWNPEPRDAAARAFELHSGHPDPMPMAEELGAGRFSGHVLRAVDRCLSIDAQNRPQDCGELLVLLRGGGGKRARARGSTRAGKKADPPSERKLATDDASGSPRAAWWRWPQRSREPAAHTASLQPTDDTAPTPIPLQRTLLSAPEGFVIGRSEEICHATVLHGSVSRRHARLRVDSNGVLIIEDLGSTGGTIVNGVRLAPFSPVPLPDGAALTIAGVGYRVCV